MNQSSPSRSTKMSNNVQTESTGRKNAGFLSCSLVVRDQPSTHIPVLQKLELGFTRSPGFMDLSYSTVLEFCTERIEKT